MTTAKDVLYKVLKERTEQHLKNSLQQEGGFANEDEFVETIDEGLIEAAAGVGMTIDDFESEEIDAVAAKVHTDLLKQFASAVKKGKGEDYSEFEKRAPVS